MSTRTLTIFFSLFSLAPYQKLISNRHHIWVALAWSKQWKQRFCRICHPDTNPRAALELFHLRPGLWRTDGQNDGERVCTTKPLCVDVALLINETALEFVNTSKPSSEALLFRFCPYVTASFLLHLPKQLFMSIRWHELLWKVPSSWHAPTLTAKVFFSSKRWVQRHVRTLDCGQIPTSFTCWWSKHQMFSLVKKKKKKVDDNNTML